MIWKLAHPFRALDTLLLHLRKRIVDEFRKRREKSIRAELKLNAKCAEISVSFDDESNTTGLIRAALKDACEERVALPASVRDIQGMSGQNSWERGLNENHNGLIRQYLPKGMALDKVTDEDIILIQNRLNNRPRKLLDYKTPNEVYEAMRLAA